MSRIAPTLLAALALGAQSLLAAPDLSKLPAPSSKSGLTYAKDIRPILEASCFRCHAAQRPKGDLRLDTLESLLKGGEHGAILIPGQSDQSLLAIAVARIDEGTAMPPMRRPGGQGGPGGPGGPPGGFPGGPTRKPPAAPDSANPGPPPPPPTAPGSGGSLKPPAFPDQKPSGAPPVKPGDRNRGPGGPDGHGGPRGPGGPGGPMPKPLTPEQVGLVRAWIDQGAK